jgi:UDP-glucose 4-epimerase
MNRTEPLREGWRGPILSSLPVSDATRRNMGGKVVVTGGAGFIGSHLTEALAGSTEVTVIDDLSTGKTERLQHLPVRLVVGDILDPSLLMQEFAGAACVFHEAAYISVPGSVANPRLTHEANITGTLNVLLAARDAGVRKVVFASSAAVYGNDPTVPKHEGMFPGPRARMRYPS